MPSAGAAFITGGTGALGRAVVARFLADGIPVAVTYNVDQEWRDLAAAEKAASQSGSLRGIRADITDEESVRSAVEEAVSSFGGIRILAHLAGGYAGGTPVERMEATSIRHMLELNLVSAFLTAKHVIPHAKQSGSGRLCFVSSRGAVEHYPGAAAYAAAKLGLHALVGTLYRELKDCGVTANAVLPSVLDTAANRASMPKADHTAWVPPASVAALLSYLVSAGAGSVSGALIPIYGRA